MRRLTFWEAVFLLVGTQIGAGVLGLPKVVAPLGTVWGSAAILLAGLLTLLTAIFLLEALYQTNPRYHIYDLSRHYLGKWGVLLTAAIVYSGYGALTAYVAGASAIIAPLLGLPETVVGILFWLALGFVVYRGLKFSGATEEALNFFMLLLFATVIVWALPHSSTYTEPFALSPFVKAFSVAVFAFFGHVIIPEIAREFRNRYAAAMVVVTAFTITMLVYLLFSLTVAGVSRLSTTDIATLGIINVVGPYFAPVAYLLPLLTISTSFIGVGLAQTDLLREVVGSRRLSILLALLPPLLLFVLGLRAFVETIFLSSLGILVASGILPPILLILSRRHRKPLYLVDTRLAYAILGVFTLILIYSAYTALAELF